MLALRRIPLVVATVALVAASDTIIHEQQQQQQPPPAIVELTAKEFYSFVIMSPPFFDVIIDVRTPEEWNEGHIANVTHMVNLAMYTPSGANDTPTLNISSPKVLDGCQYCTIAAYCRSGSRARQALQILQDSGYVGRLYNGLGVSQWTDAGYPLTTQPQYPKSKTPPCTIRKDTCKKDDIPTSPSSPTAATTTTMPPAQSPSSRTKQPTLSKCEMNRCRRFCRPYSRVCCSRFNRRLRLCDCVVIYPWEC